MHLRDIGRQFTQMNAYFLVMNSKRCNRLEEELEYQLQRTVTKNSWAMFISHLKGEKSRPVFNCFKFVFKEIVLRYQRESETLEFGIKEDG